MRSAKKAALYLLGLSGCLSGILSVFKFLSIAECIRSRTHVEERFGRLSAWFRVLACGDKALLGSSPRNRSNSVKQSNIFSVYYLTLCILMDSSFSFDFDAINLG